MGPCGRAALVLAGLMAVSCRVAGPPRSVLDAQDGEWRRIAEEAFKRYALGGNGPCVQYFEEHFRVALAWRDKGDLEKAREHARRAVSLWPESLDAMQLLRELSLNPAGTPIK